MATAVGVEPSRIEMPAATRFRHLSITIPEDALSRIDSYAERTGKTRSALLVEGALALATKREDSSRPR